MENLSKQTGATDASIANRMQEMEETIFGVEETREEIDLLVGENSKAKKVATETIQKIWDTMKRPNLRIIEIEEGEEYQLKGIENMLNRIIEESFSSLKKEIHMKVQKAFRTPNRRDCSQKTTCHIVSKPLEIQNKTLRAAKEEGQVANEGRPIRITPDFSMETLKYRFCMDVMQTLQTVDANPYYYTPKISQSP
ncbi:hypothetical protein STEG23_002730 [Scotinomys teguina]